MKLVTRLSSVAVVMLACAAPALAQPAAPSFSVSVAGNSVSLAITPVAGALGHRIQIGTFAGGADLLNALVPVALTTPAGALPVGAYFIRLASIDGTGAQGPFSAEQAFSVGTPKPGVPRNFTAVLSGGDLAFTWAPPSSGGAPLQYALQVGRSFGASNVTSGVAIDGGATSFGVNIGGVLPAGTYFARLLAVNGTGVSSASEEAIFTVGASVPGVPIPGDPIVNGNDVTLRWSAPVGGAPVTNYVIEAGGDPRAIGPVFVLDGSQTSLSLAGVPTGAYYWRVRGVANGVPGGVFGTATLAVNLPAPPPGNRTPNPAAGRRLPLPSYAAAVVNQVAAAYPGDVRNSCRELGGNNLFLFRLVRELRKLDTRWGLNWKRGGVGDLSQDAVTYNYGTLPDEWPAGTISRTLGTTQVYIIDVIGGHCGGNPGPFFDDKTQVTVDSGTVGMFTIVPYTLAGFGPDEPQQ